MSKKNKKDKKDRFKKMEITDQRTKRTITVPSDAVRFANMTIKDYKKENKDRFDSKKELKEAYNNYLLDLLPDTIEFLIWNGFKNIDEVVALKNEMYKKIIDEKFVKLLKNTIKDGEDIKNIKLLPIILKDILSEAERFNRQQLAEDPNAKITDLSDVLEVSKLILKKRLKKMEKAGVETNLAFDVLSTIPTEKASDCNRSYRARSLFEVLYEHAKTEEIPFDIIMENLIDEEYYGIYILFSLLERKEKFGELTDSQKAFYLKVSTWDFNTMEKALDDENVITILNSYVKSRKRDEGRGHDGARRYALSSLSIDEYPRIAGIIAKMISKDDSIKKYL